ncbi:MAG: hypothetical protein ACI9EW_002220 [Cellvibrionaceae bacterium]|jgi:hypothetical protein
MYSIIVHVNNEEPVVGEVETLPNEDAMIITLQNPRRRDGQEVHYLDEDTSTMILPFHRINFIQIMPSAEADDVIGFVRE